MSNFSEFLKNHRVANLAYIDKGVPQCCAVWYYSKGIDIYFLTSLTTRHGRVFSQSPQVAFTVNRDRQDWKLIRGLQGRGIVNEIPFEEEWQGYLEKYPFANSLLESSGDEMMRFWHLSPSWLRLIDNSINFGYKEEQNFF